MLSEYQLEILSKPMECSFNPETGVYRFSISEVPWVYPEYDIYIERTSCYKPLESYTPKEIQEIEYIEDPEEEYDADIFHFWIKTVKGSVKISYILPCREPKIDDYYLAMDRSDSSVEWVLIPKENIK